MTSNAEKIKQNLIFTMEKMSQVSPCIVMERTPQMIRYESNLSHPLYNRVITYYGALYEGALDEIGSIAARYKTRKVPFTWLTWSHDSGVVELSHVLEANGLKKVDEILGMSLSLIDWTYDTQMIPGLDIKPIRTSTEMNWFRDIVPTVFEMDGEAGEVLVKISQAVAIRENPTFHHYIGFINGKPVAAVTAVHDRETIGIYNVSTVETYRRRGLGSALIIHALREGQAAGGRIAVLQASNMGEGVYLAIGFRVNVTIEVYLG